MLFPRRRHLRHATLCALLALSACTQEAPPAPPPAAPPDPAVSAKELNSLAAPVIPKPGSGIRLKSLARPADSAAPQAQAQPQQPAPSLAPALPPPQAASKLAAKPAPGTLAATKPGANPVGAAPAAPAKPAAPAENVDLLINPILPGTKIAQKPTIETRLDKRDLEALSAPDLPPPPPGTKGAPQVAQPLAAEPPPEAAAPAPDPTNTFAAALPSGERASSAAGTPAAWLITARGVGGLLIGARLAGITGDIASRYTTALYGDAQPLEGFVLEEPPVFLTVRNGPFSGWSRAHTGEPVPDAIKQRAVELAEAGKLSISTLVITEKGPKTDRGVGVGDSYASFAKAYPGAGTPAKFPPLWEEPTCVITQKTLWFFFDRCDERAKIKRIVVRGRR
ncbi:MAG TPA: hypothetical protein VFG30_34800 [Polyangiales bacterium]|nr:hypothetical protein [Polyangiales bacterium]